MSPMHPDLTALVGRRLAELGYGGRRLSYRQAAKRAEDRGTHLSPETIRRLHLGTHSGRVEDATVDGLAAALGVSRAEILRAMHEQVTAPLATWEPPPTAQKMTLRQRRVVEAMILLLTDDRDATGSHEKEIVPVETDLPARVTALVDDVDARRGDIEQIVARVLQEMGADRRQTGR